MPAAAVIPAPIVYIKVVAVKKLVVEPRAGGLVLLFLLIEGSGLKGLYLLSRISFTPGSSRSLACGLSRVGYFTLKKFECSKQA